MLASYIYVDNFGLFNTSRRWEVTTPSATPRGWKSVSYVGARDPLETAGMVGEGWGDRQILRLFSVLASVCYPVLRRNCTRYKKWKYIFFNMQALVLFFPPKNKLILHKFLWIHVVVINFRAVPYQSIFSISNCCTKKIPYRLINLQNHLSTWRDV